MTKKLEDLFDLPTVDFDKIKEEKQEDKIKHEQVFSKVDDLVKTAPRISTQQMSHKTDIELDEVSQNAMDAYLELMDLGRNVESRYSARLFEVASAFLKISLDAKNTKVSKLMKTTELNIKKEKNDYSKMEINTDHVITDRNSLLEKIRNIK